MNLHEVDKHAMKDFRLGYLYSLAPIHCGGEGNLGNILEIAREAHTNFPYVPGSSLRGTLRDEVAELDATTANRLFGRELVEGSDEPMGVHQVWFGDARLLWVPMRTLALSGGRNVFAWVSCHSLIRDAALRGGIPLTEFPDTPTGTRPGTYVVADAQLQVAALSPEQQASIALASPFPPSLQQAVQPTWDQHRIVLPDADFQILMEHSLWTQVRNKIQDSETGANNAGAAEVFWTDVCIPRDTLLYFPWGYRPAKVDPITPADRELMQGVLAGLIQVGGQANVGRGWCQGWAGDRQFPGNATASPNQPETTTAATIRG